MTQKYCTEGCTGRTGSVLIRFYGCESVSPSALNENEVPDADTDGETGIGLDRHG